MRTKAASADLEIAQLAGRQHGICTTRQLRLAGLTEAGIVRRLRAARLHRVHRGVYAVGHRALSLHGRWLAAVLACGTTAVLSHRSAAELWGLLPPRAAAIGVTVPGLGGRSMRRGIRIHRSGTLTPAMVTRRGAIPCTNPARTLADLKNKVSAATFRQARRQAAILGLPLGDEPFDRTRSELEHAFLDLLGCHRIPIPEVNVRLAGHTVDFLWRDQRLVVETDGFAYHRGREAFDDDRARDLSLRLAGFQVLRFSFKQVEGEPKRVAGLIRNLVEG